MRRATLQAAKRVLSARWKSPTSGPTRCGDVSLSVLGSAVVGMGSRASSATTRDVKCASHTGERDGVAGERDGADQAVGAVDRQRLPDVAVGLPEQAGGAAVDRGQLQLERAVEELLVGGLDQRARHRARRRHAVGVEHGVGREHRLERLDVAVLRRSEEGEEEGHGVKIENERSYVKYERSIGKLCT